MLAETPVTQHSPYYFAVSSSLTNPSPHRSNYLPFCHTHYLIFWIPFTRWCHKSTRVIFPCCSLEAQCLRVVENLYYEISKLRGKKIITIILAVLQVTLIPVLKWTVYCMLRPRSRNLVEHATTSSPDVSSN